MEQNMNTAMPAMNTSQQGSNNGFKIATAIASVIAICGIGFGIFGMVQSAQKDNQISDLKIQIKNDDGTVTTIETPKIETTTGDGSVITISDMPESIDQDSEVKQVVKKVYEAIGKNYNYRNFHTIFSDGSMIKIPNTDTYTRTNRSYGVYLDDENDYRTIMDNAHVYAETALKDNGFSEDREKMGGRLFYNSRSGIYCDVSEFGEPFTMGCSKDTWITDEDKELSMKLAKITDLFYISASSSKITDSQITPYQRITTYGPNAAYLFYRTSPSSEWQFFTGTQAMLSCDDYNTEDLKKAYAGERCWDETTNQESTVQP